MVVIVNFHEQTMPPLGVFLLGFRQSSAPLPPPRIMSTRTIKQIIAANLAMLPEASKWLPIIEQADDSGFLPTIDAGSAALSDLGLDRDAFDRWCEQRRQWINVSLSIRDVAELHEFWVDCQAVAA